MYIIVLFITRHENSGVIATEVRHPIDGNGPYKHDNISLLLIYQQLLLYQLACVYLKFSYLHTVVKYDRPTLLCLCKSGTKCSVSSPSLQQTDNIQVTI